MSVGSTKLLKPMRRSRVSFMRFFWFFRLLRPQGNRYGITAPGGVLENAASAGE
jgi:hypothetical protein